MRKQTIVIALLLLIAVFGLPAAAYWSYDGFSLDPRSSGTVTGDVYVGVGDNDGSGFTNQTLNINYTTNYTLPANITVDWARVYVDAWGGNQDNNGTINMSLNGGPWRSEFYDGTLCTNPDCRGSGHGVVWVWFNETNVTPGINQVNVTSTLFEGRIIRVVLVCAYNDTSMPLVTGERTLVHYWVNDGNYNLHYNGTVGYPQTDNTTAWFNGTVVTNDCTHAKLATVYHASGGGANGNEAEPDYLYFNVIPTLLNHSPYYHRPNQLGDNGDAFIGDDDYADGGQFTLRSWDVTGLINATNNSATFWRGHDDNDDGWIYHNMTWTNSTGAEGEAYLHPSIAVFTAKSCCAQKERYAWMELEYVSGASTMNVISLPLMENESISTAFGSIQGDYIYVHRYNPTTGSWETYNPAQPNPPFSAFNVLDPLRGYVVDATSDCTLTWTSK